MAPALKLTYFGLPGRGETQRLLAVLGGLDLEDKRIDFAEWGAGLKEKLAPRQVPLLEVDGELFGQSVAQQRYAAKLAGLYPSDPLEALRVDELVDYVEELFGVVRKGHYIEDKEVKVAFHAKEAAEGGEYYKWAQFLDKRLAGKTYAVGDSLSLADVQLFAVVPFLRSGFLEGIPKDWDAGFKNLRAHFERVAALPKVAEYYAKAEGLEAVYKL